MKNGLCGSDPDGFIVAFQESGQEFGDLGCVNSAYGGGGKYQDMLSISRVHSCCEVFCKDFCDYSLACSILEDSKLFGGGQADKQYLIIELCN
jgi:hypothetical protein